MSTTPDTTDTYGPEQAGHLLALAAQLVAIADVAGEMTATQLRREVHELGERTRQRPGVQAEAEQWCTPALRGRIAYERTAADHDRSDRRSRAGVARALAALEQR